MTHIVSRCHGSSWRVLCTRIASLHGHWKQPVIQLFQHRVRDHVYPVIQTKLIPSTSCRCMATSPRQETIMNVFDRKAKRIQRNRTALLKDFKEFDYIKEEVGWRMFDRMCDINRKFDVVVDIGCGRGHVSKHMTEDLVGLVYQCDMAEKVLAQSEVSDEVPTYRVHADEEFFPFKEKSVDLVVSNLSMHWVNDLPGAFKQIQSALKSDGAFLGSMFGGDTLFQLRVSLQLAETEREGGFAAHVSPFTDVQDLGNLLNRAGYTMLTIDVDEMTANFPTMFELMRDLKGMGENNCAWSRKAMLHRDTLQAAAAIYKDMYGNEDGTVPATFQIIYFIGWKPDPSQAKAAKRGSGQVSLKDLGRLSELSKELEDLRKKTPKDGGEKDDSKDIKRSSVRFVVKTAPHAGRKYLRVRVAGDELRTSIYKIHPLGCVCVWKCNHGSKPDGTIIWQRAMYCCNTEVTQRFGCHK